MNVRSILSLLLALQIAACPAVCGAARGGDDPPDPCCASSEKCPGDPPAAPDPAPCPDDGGPAGICTGAVHAGEARDGTDRGEIGPDFPVHSLALAGVLLSPPDPPLPPPPREPTAWGGLASRGHWLALLQVFLT